MANDILRRWLAAPCILLLTVTAYSQDFDRAKPGELGISAERLERLSATLEDYVEQEQVAGSVTLVLRRGWVVYFDAVGYRDAASRRPCARTRSSASPRRPRRSSAPPP